MQHNVIIKKKHDVTIRFVVFTVKITFFVIFTVKITECVDVEFYSKDKLQYVTVEKVINILILFKG
jgi:hypothetical protein